VDAGAVDLISLSGGGKLNGPSIEESSHAIAVRVRMGTLMLLAAGLVGPEGRSIRAADDARRQPRPWVGGLSSIAIPPGGWRGTVKGQYPAATPVTKWSAKEKDNIVWKTEVGMGTRSRAGARACSSRPSRIC